MSDLKVGEAFKDKVFITTTSTGVARAGLAGVTCTLIDESGNRSVNAVVEEGNGWYTSTFTPDAAGTWSTEWNTAAPATYTVEFARKIFKVGGGTIADIYADTPYITDAALPVSPTANSLAAKLSRFTADGDGDFATGTPLPSNTSLYDALTFKYQAPASIAQASPDQNVWYTVLNTTANCRIYHFACSVAATGETLAWRIIIDGQTLSQITVACTAATSYWGYLNASDDGKLYCRLSTTLSDQTSKAFMIEGRSISVDVRKTTAAGTGTLAAIVTYGIR